MEPCVAAFTCRDDLGATSRIPTRPAPVIRIRSLAPLGPVKIRMSCAVEFVVARTRGCALVVPMREPVVPFHASDVEFPAVIHGVPPIPAVTTLAMLAWSRRPLVLARTIRSFVPTFDFKLVAILPIVTVDPVLPIVVAPALVPVLMLVAKFELALMFVIAPEIVAPADPVMSPVTPNVLLSVVAPDTPSVPPMVMSPALPMIMRTVFCVTIRRSLASVVPSLDPVGVAPSAPVLEAPPLPCNDHPVVGERTDVQPNTPLPFVVIA